MTADRPSAVHIPALDGLRGIAILLVLVFHGFYLSARENENAFDSAVSKVTNSGWVGVDLFFVLSGFLITGILLDGRGASANPGSFYARRVLRIVPLYFGFLFFLMYLMPLVAASSVDEGVAILRGNQAWYWTFLLNVKLALEPIADLGRFGNGHLWSLMVEEQFYLVWPIVVLLLPRRFLLPVLIACIVAAPVFRYAVLDGAFPRIQNSFSAYVLMPARMDALAFGAVVALLLRERALWSRARPFVLPLGALAMALIIVIALAYGDLWWTDRWTQIAGYTCIAALFAAIVMHTAAPDGNRRAAAALSIATLAFFGRYSYALYVFHFQIMYGASQRWDPPVIAGTDVPGRLFFTLVTGACATGLAWLSWHLYESRFLALKKYVPYGSRPADAVPVTPVTAVSDGRLVDSA